MANGTQSGKFRELFGFNKTVRGWGPLLVGAIGISICYAALIWQVGDLRAQATAEGLTPSVTLLGSAVGNFMCRLGCLLLLPILLFIASAKTMLSGVVGLAAAVFLGSVGTVWHGLVIGMVGLLCLAVRWDAAGDKGYDSKLSA